MMNFIKELKSDQIKIKSIRMDNSGENCKFAENLKVEDAEIKVEFTAPNTPQQNGTVERKFQTLKGRGRAMLNWAGVTKEKRERLWSEVMNHATKLDGILVTRSKPIMNDVALYGKQPKWIDKLKRF